MSDTSSAERRQQSPEEMALQRHIAKALWKAQKGKDIPKDAAERQKMWQDEKKEMMVQARHVARNLQLAGVAMQAPAKKA